MDTHPFHVAVQYLVSMLAQTWTIEDRERVKACVQNIHLTGRHPDTIYFRPNFINPLFRQVTALTGLDIQQGLKDIQCIPFEIWIKPESVTYYDEVLGPYKVL